MDKLDNVFLQHCADVLASTHSPLSGGKITKLMNAYSVDYGVSIPDTISIEQEPNKRTLLYDYLRCFSLEEQINILKELCNHSVFEGYDHIDEIKQLEFALQKRTNRETNVIPNVSLFASHKIVRPVLEQMKNINQSTESIAMNEADQKVLVFISHSSNDAAIINAFKTHILIAGIGLTDNNIICTSFEETGINASDNIPEYIKDNIENSQVVLCMISQNYRHSEVCQNEVGAAWALKKKIIQIVLPDSTFDNIGWLMNLDKAVKIDKSYSLDNLQGNLCDFLSLQIKSAKQWNPHKDNFLSALATIQKNTNVSDGTQNPKAQMYSNEAKEYDKKQFAEIDRKWSEPEILSTIDSILRMQKYNDYQADFLENLEYHNKYVMNHFIDEELQHLFSLLCESINNLLLFLGTYYFPSRFNRNDNSLEGKNQNEIDDIKKRRFYVWHENHDLPDDLYRERYAIMCTDFPKLCNRVLSAYEEFRRKIKNKLFV